MRRVLLILSFIVVQLVLVASVSANTISREIVQQDEIVPLGICNFPVNLHYQGTFKRTNYYNSNGQLIKTIESPYGGLFSITISNATTATSLTIRSEAVVLITTYNSDGTPRTLTLSGPNALFVARGSGPVLFEVGRIVIDLATGEVTFQSGTDAHHQIYNGDFTEVCDALANAQAPDHRCCRRGRSLSRWNRGGGTAFARGAIQLPGSRRRFLRRWTGLRLCSGGRLDGNRQ
jgi:hypothetical protein